jgi:hypothetical protein
MVELMQQMGFCAKLLAMSVPVLPKDKSTPAKPFTGIKRPIMKVLKPHQLDLGELLRDLRKR